MVLKELRWKLGCISTQQSMLLQALQCSGDPAPAVRTDADLCLCETLAGLFVEGRLCFAFIAEARMKLSKPEPSVMG